ncbi:choice-of-anchor D domain-containing protein [Conexibacter woesei]|uniref:Collagen triple helix repeat protein n=1 Tax=Conexibacter woesei (strain DSM 14684 / CCUG 47730 / CIP 108061 / JCM 11494 / NBRC 100937 / ID131577) TaxID=469383 RepID=D3F179_CONWI|nr:choice-of-anchor D domain-containing protein [Conexibacter woesei]ADB50155.1 hypothetical protein Cwoe_1728 [Conexibacter woesei DSM 14684]
MHIRVHRRVVAVRAAFALLVCVAIPVAALPAAASAATDQQVADSVAASVRYLRGEQDPASGVIGCISGPGIDCPADAPSPFGGDWALLGLAGAGVHAADLRTAPGAPSAQDYYAGLWAAEDGRWATLGQLQASDYARTIMASHSIGVQPTRISARQNLLAGLAGFYDGGNFAVGLVNQTIFALIALQQTPLAQSPAGQTVMDAVAARVLAAQRANGTWTPYPDINGAALAALCGLGRRDSEPVRRGIAAMLAQRGPTRAGFGNPNATSWALAGLAACGIRRGDATWNAEGLESAIDQLLTFQIPAGGDPSSAGGFSLLPGGAVANLYASQDGLRALAAPGFSVAAPARANPSDPVVRPAPAVAAGTPVPIALAIDYGYGAARLCATTAPAGAALIDVLAAARAGSQPAGCVTDLLVENGRVTRINGRSTATGGVGWKVSVDGAAEVDAGAQPVGFGETVALRLVDPQGLDVSSWTLDLGTQPQGALGVARTVTLTNRRATAVELRAVRVVGAQRDDFLVSSEDCAGETLAAGASCTVAVRFAPSAAGASQAELRVIVAGTDEPPAVVQLSGVGGDLPTGPRGNDGAVGPQGSAGAPAAAGARGPAGPRGQRGAQGKAGRDAKVSCRLLGSGRRQRVSCRVTVAGKRSSAKAAARLVRGGRTFARGSVSSLRPVRAIKPGRYSLRLGSGGTVTTIKATVR